MNLGEGIEIGDGDFVWGNADSASVSEMKTMHVEYAAACKNVVS